MNDTKTRLRLMMQSPVDRVAVAKLVCIMAIGLTAILFLAAALFRVLLFLIREGKGEYLLHPLAVMVGSLFVYYIARYVVWEIRLQQAEIIKRLDKLEQLVMDKKLDELRKIKEGEPK